MIIGYARVSTQDQNPELQLEALRGAGCEELFQEKATGPGVQRLRRRAMLEFYWVGMFITFVALAIHMRGDGILGFGIAFICCFIWPLIAAIFLYAKLTSPPRAQPPDPRA